MYNALKLALFGGLGSIGVATSEGKSNGLRAINGSSGMSRPIPAVKRGKARLSSTTVKNPDIKKHTIKSPYPASRTVFRNGDVVEVPMIYQSWHECAWSEMIKYADYVAYSDLDPKLKKIAQEKSIEMREVASKAIGRIYKWVDDRIGSRSDNTKERLELLRAIFDENFPKATLGNDYIEKKDAFANNESSTILAHILFAPEVAKRKNDELQELCGFNHQELSNFLELVATESIAEFREIGVELVKEEIEYERSSSDDLLDGESFISKVVNRFGRTKKSDEL